MKILVYVAMELVMASAILAISFQQFIYKTCSDTMILWSTETMMTKKQFMARISAGAFGGCVIVAICWYAQFRSIQRAFRSGTTSHEGVFGTRILTETYYLMNHFNCFSVDDISKFFENRVFDSSPEFVVEEIVRWNRQDCVPLLKAIKVKGEEFPHRINVICTIAYLSFDRPLSKEVRMQEFIAVRLHLAILLKHSGLRDQASDGEMQEILTQFLSKL